MDNIEKHKQICAELTDLYAAKNADYGDSFHKSFEKYGLTMAVIRLGDKFNRIEKLASGHHRLVEEESIRDTLLDLANYAIMTVAEIDKTEKETGDNKVDGILDNQKFVQILKERGIDVDAGIRHMEDIIQAEEDGRLVVLQKGVTVHHLQEEYRKAKHTADERLPSPSYTTGRIAGFGEGVIHILDKILTREEAEAALKKREEDS